MDSASKKKASVLPAPRARTASNAATPINANSNTTSRPLKSGRGSASASKPPSARRVAESGNLRGANATSTPTETSQPPSQKILQAPATPTAAQKTPRTPNTVLSVDKRRAIVSPPIKNPTQGTPTPHRSVSGVKRTLEVKDEESEDEGGGIRSSQRLRKRSKANEEGGYAIGCHIDEHLLTVFAKLKAQSLYETVQTVMMYAVKTPDLPASITDDICWNELVYTNSQVPLSKVKLSSKVFPKYVDELKDKSNDRKLTLIEEYLFAMKKKEEFPDNGDEDVEETLVKYIYLPEYLEVGHHKDDDTVPVQAHVRQHASNVTPWVMFKVLKEDGKRSKMDFSIRSVKDVSKIKFKPEFEKVSIEGTKMEIFSRFIRHVADTEREDSRSPKPISQKASTASADDKSEIESPAPKRISLQSTRTSASDDESETGDTIIVRPRHPILSTYSALASANIDVEKAMLSLRAAESEISESHLKFKEEKAQFLKEKSAIEARDVAVQRKVNAYLELEGRVTVRESAVEARENAVKELEIRVKAREDAVGALGFFNKEERELSKEKKEIEAAKQNLSDLQARLDRDTISLRDRRAAFKEEEAKGKLSSKEREEALNERATTIEKKEDLLKGREEAISERENVVKQRDDVVKRQKDNPLETLSNLTDAQVREFMQNNTLAERIIRNNINKKVTRETDKFKKEHAERTKLFEERENKLKQRETELSKKEAASTTHHPSTPNRSATPTAVQTQGTPKLSLPFGLVIPQPLLAKGAFFEEHYRLIPEGMPNAGMYMRNSGSRELDIEGKRFRVDRFLRECTYEKLVASPTIAVDGTKLAQITQHGGHDLDHYVKDSKLKLVQQFSMRSFVHDRSRFFVSWYVYKQIDDMPDFTI